MTNIRRALEAAAATGGDATYVEDVYSTYLYTGTGAELTITNDIDLDGEGGLVWVKSRNAVTYHHLSDTERGANKDIYSNDTSAESTETQALKVFNSDGFTIGTQSQWNTSADTYVSWTFRKAPGFFDIVTYTGNGSAQTIAHSLGSTPGMIIVKNLDSSTNWETYHKDSNATPEDYKLELNENAAAQANSDVWNDTAPTSTEFTVGTNNSANLDNYVVYLFADDDQIFGAGSDESIIACGGYTGNSGTQAISLGWEAQYVMLKKTSAASNWLIFDMMRGVPTGGDDCALEANTTAVEDCGNEYLSFTADGFQLDGGNMNYTGDEYIYMAIRRGPMKVPEAGTEIYSTDTRGSTGDGVAPTYRSPFPVDMQFNRNRTYAGGDTQISARLTQARQMHTNLAGSESTNSGMMFDYMNGVQTDTGTSVDQTAWMFKRAPEFMDIVCYAGNTISGHTIDHNLGVVPEMMITKTRTAGYTRGWAVYHKDVYPSGDMSLFLNTDQAETADGVYYPTTPTATSYTVGTDAHVNNASNTYNAYLWATLAGVSKVGSYTADATLTTIDCGFAAGARFILIKRTDSTGDWYYWDSARGIVAGNDPYLLINDTAAEVTGTDYIDPDNSGFQITAAGSSTININTGEYIFLAIA